MTRYLIIPLKEGKVFDFECNEAIILAPTRNQANKHVKYNISKLFHDWIIKPIETNFDFSGR